MRSPSLKLALVVLQGGMWAFGQFAVYAESYSGPNGAVAAGDNAVAIGESASAAGDASAAVGNISDASQDSAIAIGNGSNASAAAATAIGQAASASEVNAIAPVGRPYRAKLVELL